MKFKKNPLRFRDDQRDHKQITEILDFDHWDMYLDQPDEDMIWEDIKWSALCPGVVIRVWKDEPIPADMVLIKSSNPENLCYVDTAQLDGETSLKPKEC